MNSFGSLLPFGLFLLAILIVTLTSEYYFHYVNGLSEEQSYKGITLKDPNLVLKEVFQGLKKPSSMAFLDKNDILVLEKDNGTVKRIVNGKMLSEPVLDVNVATEGGRGMLGINVAKHANGGPTYVLLYFIESSGVKGLDAETGGKAHLYRYELKDNKLINPRLLIDVSGARGVGNKTDEFHNGGKILIGPDQNVYLVVGDLSNRHTSAQNLVDRDPPDGSSSILRVTLEGKPVKGGNILGDINPLNKYYAYGIRNSFGMDFDPITGKLWDTENGPHYGDEINLVDPGFNSGYRKVQGIWKFSYDLNPLNHSMTGYIAPSKPEGLVDFNGKGRYSPPEFTWLDSVGPTAIKFLNSDKLGKQYENDMFVGDVRRGGNIYHFDLDNKRENLLLKGPLHDKVADNMTELKDVIFGHGFGGITDMQVGPDGYLYILSYGLGTIFKIVTK